VQRTSSPNRNFFWPALLIGLGALLLALALDAFPPTVADLIRRAWPALLVLIGLTVLLDQIGAVRRFAPLIALVLVAGGLAVLLNMAYANRAGTLRNENVVRFAQPLDETVQSLHVIVRGLETSVEISPTIPDQQAILSAEFQGSTESVVEPQFEVGADGVATFSLVETRPDAIPALETMGRGQMRLELPLGMPIVLDFTNDNGIVSLNLLGLQVTRLDVVMSEGDLLLSLPTTALERRAEVFVSRGDVTVFVPDSIGLQVTTNGKTPQFAEGTYLVDPSSSAYLTRRFDTFDTTIDLNLTVGGSIRLE
jgi:hypothetical protein